MSAARDPRLDVAYAWCEATTRQRARNFYYGLKLTPEPQRSAMFAIYAWMRRADDLVDADADDPDQRRERVDAFRRLTDQVLESRGRLPVGAEEPLWIALSDTAQRFRLSHEHFHGMLDGQLDDLCDVRYETFEDLARFCYRVASTVGLLCISVWGYRDPSARDLAIDRGIAFQLTNILRDFREDFDQGRIYLPQEDFRRHDLTPEALRSWSKPGACRAFVLEQAARVQSFYESSAALEPMITPSCVPTLWAMTTIYHGLLEKIFVAPERIAGPRRIRLSSLRKALIAFRARRMAQLAPRDLPAVLAEGTAR